MKKVTFLGIATPLVLLLLAAAPMVFSDDYDKKTDVTIDRPIQVPGATLQPGKYMFILMNSSSDRHIVEIKSEDGKKLYATTFTTAARRLRPEGKKEDGVILTFYEMPAGTPDALRQWFWPGDTEGQEFLYSHKQAAEIKAARHQEEAVAETNEEPPAASTQAAEATDQQSAQQVAEQPAPAQPLESTQTQEQSQVTVAQAAPAPVVVDNPPADNSNELLAQNNPAPAPVPDTTVSQPPAQNYAANNDNDNSSLPKTASSIPLVGLLGLISLAGGAVLKLAWRS
jgi:hypothetical protein